MIELKNITKSYDFKVLDQISITMKKNNIYLLKGISGSGKTTLLNIIAGLDNEYSGDYLINGKKINKLGIQQTDEFRKKIGYITQQSLLFHNLNILDNLLFIKNDIKEIKKLSLEFGVSNLLNKMPHQLSGGERQRIALIRALLYDCDILIADEPTSALDQKNSVNFAKQLSKIKNKIIIIATHKDIYDSIADEIICIESGHINTNIKNVNTNKQIPSKLNHKETEKNNKRDEFKIMYKYISSRKKNKNIFIATLAILILIIIFSLIFYLHYKDIYFDYTISKYPYDIIELNKDDYNILKEHILYTYDEYKYSYEDMIGYTLLKEEDSNFKIENVIEYGNFPKNKYEILVNLEFLKKFYPNEKFTDFINKEINIDNNKFIISGIVSLRKNNDPFEVYYSNPYYSKIYNSSSKECSPAFFIMYEYIKEIGIKNECYNSSDTKLAKLDLKTTKKLYKNSKAISKVSEFVNSRNYTQWKNRIDNQTSFIEFISSIIILIVAIVSILAILFLSNQVKLELFYRKKEFGYLQLFHINKNKIILMVLLEYLYDIFKAIIFSMILFSFITIFVLSKFNILILKYLYLYLLIFIIISIYSLIIIIFPVKNILATDIKKLIK